MSSPWCSVCQTRHASRKDCPGELLATGPERHGWRVLVRAGARAEVHGVLIAEVGDRWRARILTFPNMLWSVPGGRGTLKFVGDSARKAESQAIEFILEHCQQRGYQVTEEIPEVDSGPLNNEEGAKGGRVRPAGDVRYLRSLVIRYGEEKPDRLGMTADLSRGGLFIVAERPLAAGQSIRMLLELDQYTVPLMGKVAWQRAKAEQGRPAGMGIQLRNPPHLYARFIRSLEE
jgi:hypothetical protein